MTDQEFLERQEKPLKEYKELIKRYLQEKKHCLYSKGTVLKLKNGTLVVKKIKASVQEGKIPVVTYWGDYITTEGKASKRTPTLTISETEIEGVVRTRKGKDE